MSKATEKISVIVPIYRVEAYLDDCVKSILKQTYSDFELILVDDGSPDHCGEMCDEYQKRDSRIRVIHKENGGLSDARNAGLRLAAGEYVTFIDSDDLVADNYLALLYEAAMKYQADIVQGEFIDNIECLGKQRARVEVVYTRDEALQHFLQQEVVVVNACAKLYRRKCFMDIEYPKGRINEDNLTTYKNIWKADKVVCIPDFIYFYRTNQNSIMRTTFSAKRFEILSFQQEIESYLGVDAVAFKDLIDYAEMRIAIRQINDCIVAGKEKECCDEVEQAKKIIEDYRPNKAVCATKYCWLVWLMKKNFTLYRQMIKKLRKW